jgi:hypothetical protein
VVCAEKKITFTLQTSHNLNQKKRFPPNTRSALAKAISEAPHRRESHGNIPL